MKTIILMLVASVSAVRFIEGIDNDSENLFEGTITQEQVNSQPIMALAQGVDESELQPNNQ